MDSQARLNEEWETYLKNNGAGFVRFVDILSLPEEVTREYACAVFFGKALPKEYLKAVKAGEKPERQEFSKAEHAMDALAKKLANALTLEGYNSVTGIKNFRLPHKTIARLAGFGFVGKNTLIVTEEYGCAVVLGKILTAAPFKTAAARIIEPKCGGCTACVDVCPVNALSGKAWSPTTTRDEMLQRNICSPCLKCMVNCPYTIRYSNYP